MLFNTVRKMKCSHIHWIKLWLYLYFVIIENEKFYFFRILTLLGYEPSEVIGKTAYHFHNPIDAPKVGDCHHNCKYDCSFEPRKMEFSWFLVIWRHCGQGVDMRTLDPEVAGLNLGFSHGKLHHYWYVRNPESSHRACMYTFITVDMK